MAKWERQVLRMQKNHGWRAKPGNKIFVADRGAVRFDFPESWVMDYGDGAIQFRDKPKPDDDVLLQVSVMRLPAGINWEQFPLPELIDLLVKDDYRGTIPSGGITHVRRPGFEYAWIETHFVDPIEKRDACSRTLLARAANIQPLITLEFWPEDRSWVEPIWDELLRSLRVGEYIKDPTRGF
jgi:hypothetical protein